MSANNTFVKNQTGTPSTYTNLFNDLQVPGTITCGTLAYTTLSPPPTGTTRWAQGVNPNDIYNINSGNVGIGTTTPTQKLEVIGTVNATGNILANGTIQGANVNGVNTITSASISSSGTLTVAGQTNLNGAVGMSNIPLISRPHQLYYDSSTKAVSYAPTPSGGSLWGVNGTNIYNVNTGMVGINNLSPTERLDVVGNIKVSGNYITSNKAMIKAWKYSTTNYTGNFNNQKVQFNGFQYNTNITLSGNTDFTVAVDGMYQVNFNTNCYLPNGVQNLSFNIFKNNNSLFEPARVGMLNTIVASVDRNEAVINTLIELVAGDVLDVRVRNDFTSQDYQLTESYIQIYKLIGY